VTTCNRCGGLLLANATVCRHCGTPVNPGSTVRPMGARQRAQERVSGPLSPSPDPFAAPPPQAPPNTSFTFPNAMSPNPGAMGGERWRGTSLIDPSNLPEWMNASLPDASARASGAAGRYQPQGGNAPQSAQPGSVFPPFPLSPSAGSMSRSSVPPARTDGGNSPYVSGGRRATDDLFASSSLLDQSRLPEWLANRSDQQGGTATPSLNNPPPARPSFGAAPRPGTGALPAKGDSDADLPPWLRALEPGAPPPPAPPIARLASGGSSTSGPLRSQPPGNHPPANQPIAQERPNPLGSALPGTDLFNASRQSGLFPSTGAPGASDNPLHPFAVSGSAGTPGPSGTPSSPRSPFPANPEPRAARSPLDQMPRPMDPLAGAASGRADLPPVPPWEMDRPRSFSRPERRSADLSPRSTEMLSPGSLIDEAALPAWLRANNPGSSAVQQSQAPKPAPTSSPVSEPKFATANLKPPKPPPAAESLPPPAPTSPFDGASLVDEASLPDWLRSSRQTEPLPLPFTVSESVGAKGVTAKNQPAAPASQSGADDEELPEWLRQVYTEAHVPPLNPEKPPSAREPGSTLSAASLVDERSVPKWIREANQTSPLPNLEDVLSAPPLFSGPPASPPVAGTTATTPPPAGAPTTWLEGNALLDEASLPEWLRTIGEPPSASSAAKTPFAPPPAAGQSLPGSTSGIFSAAELIDTQALPAWMKTEESKASPAQPGDAPREAKPAGSTSGIFSAAELIDTQALPAWMKTQEPQAAPAPPADTPREAKPAGSTSGIFSAAELIDTQALPAWMKTQKPQIEFEAPVETSETPRPSGSTSGIFSAAELIDTQALPAWIKEQDQGPAGSQTPSEERQTSTGKHFAASKISPMPIGFSAAELVDTQDLPAWLKGATGPGGPAPAAPEKTRRSVPEANEEHRLSGADLIDTQDLPAWLKGADTRGASMSAPGGAPLDSQSFSASASSSGMFQAASLVDPDALPDWLRPAQTSEGAPVRQSNPLSGAPPSDAERDPFERGGSPERGLSAASLIDEEQLPDWMRTPGGLERPGVMSGGEASSEEGLHARVPRRPRLPTEPDRAPSQAAANVFASVLGPAAGEAQRAQPQDRPASRQREAPPAEREELPGRSGLHQYPEWEGAGQGGRNQPSAPMPRGGKSFQSPRGAFEDAPSDFEQGERDGFSTWPVDDEIDAPAPARPERMSGAQRGWHMPPDESEGAGGPPNRRSGRTVIGPESGRAGPWEQERYGGRKYDEYSAPGQQRRGQQRFDYQDESTGWEGGPPYDPNFQGDEEAGPPSGVFAKLKRMLGLGR